MHDYAEVEATRVLALLKQTKGGGEVKLIYIDPHCSGLQVKTCTNESEIEAIFKEQCIDEDRCVGEVVHYVFVKKDGTAIQGKLDFT